ncbi:unnamed protein product [Spirodela intermedia]|uniref:SHSP domain-containing protein n=1 Tax=Spirodela intermedia TaxID=51605 RepID=A0A7I8JSD8_SPIIN|nr:unnamed protein product [Spirodela intermedia]CAA6672342.1 unnamed protein product [Spirodela intermedia]
MVTVSTPFSMDASTRSALAFSGAGTVSGTPRCSSPRAAASIFSGHLGSFPGIPFDNSSLSWPLHGWDSDTFARARVDWKETPEAHVFTADLPGVKKEEVKVQVEDGRIMQISGRRSKEEEEEEEKNETWHRNAKADLVRESMENGVLIVTVPKEQVKKPKIKTIEISGGVSGPTSRTRSHWSTNLLRSLYPDALCTKKQAI